MAIINIIEVTILFSLAVWLIPGFLGGLITAFALRREKIPLQIQDVISIGGQWMFACFLGGLVVFGLLFLTVALIPENQTVKPSVFMLIENLCFGVGAAVMGARGAKIILNVLDIS